MAAQNLGCIWRKNLNGAPAPLKFPFNFQAGASQAIKSGQIIDTGTRAPLASDKAMAGIILVADAEIRDGDKAGYHMAIVPRDGDVFEIALDAAAAPAVAAPLYWYDTDAQTLTPTPGTNIIGYVVDESTIPLQGFQSVSPSYDAGTTIRTVSKVLFVFKKSVSYYAALQP